MILTRTKYYAASDYMFGGALGGSTVQKARQNMNDDRDDKRRQGGFFPTVGGLAVGGAAGAGIGHAIEGGQYKNAKADFNKANNAHIDKQQALNKMSVNQRELEQQANDLRGFIEKNKANMDKFTDNDRMYDYHRKRLNENREELNSILDKADKIRREKSIGEAELEELAKNVESKSSAFKSASRRRKGLIGGIAGGGALIGGAIGYFN